MKNFIKDFYKECFNWINIKTFFIFLFIPYILTQNIIVGIYWSISYLLLIITIWILVRYNVIKTKKLNNHA